MKQLKNYMQPKKMKHIFIAFFFALSLLSYVGYKIYRHYYLSTDDAYVNANIVQIAPRVTGRIVKTYFNDNQYVKKDQILFDIDPEPFQLEINAVLAQLNLSNAELDKATLAKDRVAALVSKNFSSQQEGDNALAAFKTAAARVDQAKASLEQARLNMAYTKVSAPTSGWVTNSNLNIGDLVQSNQPLFALVSDEVFWVDANFKETQVAAIEPNQYARIVTDLYPDHPYDGVVESISAGTGSVFSLLPPQNATGNWVKVTQRIPVRVRITNMDPSRLLPIGISATVTISLQKNVSPNKK